MAGTYEDGYEVCKKTSLATYSSHGSCLNHLRNATVNKHSMISMFSETKRTERKEIHLKTTFPSLKQLTQSGRWQGIGNGKTSWGSIIVNYVNFGGNNRQLQPNGLQFWFPNLRFEPIFCTSGLLYLTYYRYLLRTCKHCV